MAELKRYLHGMFVYFGLAARPGDPPAPRRPTWFYMLSVVLGVSASVSLKHALGVNGTLSAVLGFVVYVIVLFLLILLRPARA